MIRMRSWARIEPISEWPGGASRSRTTAAWRATEGDTWSLLGSEIDKLNGKNVRIGLAVRPEQLVLTGERLRAGEQPWHPGVIVKFDTKQGELRYACDAFIRHVDNLRSIAKTLEALRALGRWGTLSGEQYRGNLAIEAARAMPSAPFRDAASAWQFIRSRPGVGQSPSDLATAGRMSAVRRTIRMAQAATHPDTGGDADSFRLVNDAADFLKDYR